VTAPLLTSLEQAVEGSRGLEERLRSEVDHPHVELRGGFCLVEREDMRAIIAMLAASTPVGGWEEPVAWRWQWPGQNTWGYADYNLHPDAETVQALAVIPTEGGEG
jgi:hypothetical protein